MMKENYKYKQKLLKIGNSRGISIPAEWLKTQCKKLGVKVISALDLLIYDDYLEIRAVKEN